MRWLPKTIPILIGIIALDLALVSGFEAWRIFTSPINGLEHKAFADLIHGIGDVADLQPDGLVKLSAFFGVINLAIAVIFALHIASRFSSAWGQHASHEMLDTGLILVVVSTLVAATPAVMQGATDILIHERLPLWLVGLAATLSMIERLPEEPPRRSGWCERLLSKPVKKYPTAMPVARCGVSSLRWNALRTEAGMAVQHEVARPFGPWFSLR